MAEGIIKWFSSERGFGFIESNSGSDVFVHRSSIQSLGYKKLNEGDFVTFDIENGKKGPAASNVTVHNKNSF